MSLLEEALEKVNQDTDECIIWPHARNNSGYGSVNGQMIHRWAYTLKKGAIPKGLDVRHTCDVRTCFNPRHLITGTRKDNMQDMVARGRSPVGAKNPMAKFTESYIQQVRALWASGKFKSHRQLSESLGNISRRHVTQILGGKRWASVQ